MSPIFVRPVREQLEHDRLIRLLQTKYKRKFEVLANVGEERGAPVRIGPNLHYPDLVLLQGKKLACLVEVETGESVNNLEAMAQWTHFSRARVPFHLYVPVPMIDASRRLATANHAHITELWTYRVVGDDFDFVRAFHDPSALAAAIKISPKAAKPEKFVEPEKPAEPEPVLTPAVKPAVKPALKPAVKPAVKPVLTPALKPAKPAAKPAPPRPAVKAAKKPAARKAAVKKPAAARRPAPARARKSGGANAKKKRK